MAQAQSVTRASGGRILATFLLLLSLLFQSYAIQTHLHPLQGIPGVTQLKLAPTGAPSNNVPADSDCAICKLVHTGQHIAPVSPVLFIVQLSVAVIETVLDRLPQYEAASHAWRGRAPPSL